MPKYRFDLKQDSPEWLDARLGIPTASEFSSILTPKELKLSKSNGPYMARKIAEWMAGMPLEDFEDKPASRGWMERGKLLEPEAVRYYEMDRNMETQIVGIITTDDGMIGASPDRLVGEVGMLEQKCPSLPVHVAYMLDPQSLLAEYRMQVQGQLWVASDREWDDVISYYPGFPSVIVRAYRDDVAQDAMTRELPKFVETMLRCRERLTQEYGELRRERVSATSRLAENHAAFDSFMNSGIGGNA